MEITVEKWVIMEQKRLSGSGNGRAEWRRELKRNERLGVKTFKKSYGKLLLKKASKMYTYTYVRVI